MLVKSYESALTDEIPLSYTDMQKHIFGSGSVVSGYAGNWEPADFAYYNGRVVYVFEFGYVVSSHLPPVVSVEEAKWLMLNNPKYKEYVKLEL